jgi:hypothetical protein
VFSSNLFTILGLRSSYFDLAGITNRFYYLKLSLIILLALIGSRCCSRMCCTPFREAVAVILSAGVVASLVRARRPGAEGPSTGMNARPRSGEDGSGTLNGQRDGPFGDLLMSPKTDFRRVFDWLPRLRLFLHYDCLRHVP